MCSIMLMMNNPPPSDEGTQSHIHQPQGEESETTQSPPEVIQGCEWPMSMLDADDLRGWTYLADPDDEGVISQFWRSSNWSLMTNKKLPKILPWSDLRLLTVWNLWRACWVHCNSAPNRQNLLKCGFAQSSLFGDTPCRIKSLETWNTDVGNA